MNVLDGAAVRADLDEETDVAVVGSGPAGASCARELSRAGLRVTVLEEGPWVRPEAFRADAFSAMAQLYRGMGATITSGRAPMPYVQGRALGGTSVVNGAISWRLPRDVWDEWVAADAALADALPWPELEAAMAEVERDLGVVETAPEIAGPKNLLMARGADALGLAHRPIRRNVRGCRGLGRCLQGCPEGNKSSMDRSFLVEAAERGARIAANVRVERVVVERGRAVAVRAVAAGGGRVFVRARHAVVLAASAVQTPVLLLQSGVRGGPVGDGFQAHPGVSVGGRFREPVRMWTGATQGHEVIGLRREGIKFEVLGYDMALVAARAKGVGAALAGELDDLAHVAHWGAAVRARARGAVRPSGSGARVRYSLAVEDVARVRRGVRVLGEMLLAAGAEWVAPGVHGFAPTVSDRAAMARIEAEGPLDARAYALAATHLFGTCRMGSDPRASVVRGDFRHHRVDGLYVADSSVFPSNTGVNPQTAICALAALAGRRISRR